ncbi:MAG: hypothetical protein ACPLW7_04960 [Minisyncoccia bacterium]
MENYRRKITTLILTTVLIVVLLLVLIIYLMRDIKQKVKLINQYQLEIQNRNLLLERIDILERESRAAKPYEDLIKKALPSEAEVFNFESLVKSLPSAQNLNISFRFGNLNQTNDNQFKNYSFNLIVSGDLNSLLKWFEEMYRLPYAFNFSQIEITKNSVGQNKVNVPQYKVQILGNIYIR